MILVRLLYGSFALSWLFVSLFVPIDRSLSCLDLFKPTGAYSHLLLLRVTKVFVPVFSSPRVINATPGRLEAKPKKAR